MQGILPLPRRCYRDPAFGVQPGLRPFDKNNNQLG